ncbi:TrkH family potassium uptake protein [Guggenheimella bovis]
MIKEKLENLIEHPAKLLAWGFAFIILTGALLLTLPFVTKNGQSIGFIDALFTATSAVCVTGLVTVTTADTWNLAGQIIVILLIQIGGLGVMTTATIGTFIAGRKISLRNRIAMKESLSEFGISGVVRLTQKIIYSTFIIELLGAFVLGFSFIPRYGIIKGAWFSLFHSISAFCNAGFDIIGPNSLADLNTVPGILIPISLLIYFGGIGFVVILELMGLLRREKLSFHSKFIIGMSLVLILVGTVFFFFSEGNNPDTIGNMSFGNKLQNAYFQSVTPRTAGYASFDQWKMRDSSMVMTEILMFIGGGPGSCAGGIKTATFGVILFTIYSIIKEKSDTEIFKHRISRETIHKAFTVFIIGVLLITTAFLLLMITETPQIVDGVRVNRPDLILFELFSAFGTVGLGAGITNLYSVFGKLILITVMYFGRVGPMTLLSAIMLNGKERHAIRYPEGRINIG